MGKVSGHETVIFFAYVEERYRGYTPSVGFVNEQHRVGSTSFWPLPFIEI